MMICLGIQMNAQLVKVYIYELHISEHPCEDYKCKNI